MDDCIDEFEEVPDEVLFDLTAALSLNHRVPLIPDLCVVLHAGGAVSGNQRAEGPPNIVVKVLSSDRNRDHVRTRQLYALAGDLEYWIFYPRNNTATLPELQNGEYVERAVPTADETLSKPLLPGLSIPLADVFRHSHSPAEAEVGDCLPALECPRPLDYDMGTPPDGAVLLLSAF